MTLSARVLMTGGVASRAPSKKSNLLSSSSPASTTSLSSSFGQVVPSSSPTYQNTRKSKRDRLFAAVNHHADTVVNEKYPSFDAGDLPQFSKEEIIVGPKLGAGFFGIVFEVQDFVLSDQNGKETMQEKAPSTTTENLLQKRRYFVDRMLCRKIKDRDDSWRMARNSVVDVTAIMEEEDLLGVSFDQYGSPLGSQSIDARAFMKEHCHRRRDNHPTKSNSFQKWTSFKSRKSNGQARYAIKILNPDIFRDPTKLYYQGVMDLNSETRLLSKLQDHPNICKLRAIGRCRNDDDGTPTTFHQDYFIILDRLYSVLDQRMAQWKKKTERYGGIFGKMVMDRHARKRKNLWVERLCAAHGLASALAHIHSKKMVHRDLKVDNIGFDLRGDVKLFDFGLARELPKATAGETESDNKTDNGHSEDWDQYSYEVSTSRNGNRIQYAYSTTWKMTGETGTPRYMSPETALNKPYNASCDTYSFCILMWQMLMLKTPFELYSAKAMCDRVWRGPQKRPPLDKAPWPISLKLLLQEGWSPNLRERPPMNRVAEVLRLEIISYNDEDDECARFGQTLDKAERRSTFVFDPEATNDVADMEDIDSISSCNSGTFSLRAISPFSTNKTKVSKALAMTKHSRDLFSLRNRDDTNTKMDNSSMSPSYVHFSPTKQSDGLVPPSSPFERTCASAVLPLLGLPLFDRDADSTSQSNEETSSCCSRTSPSIKSVNSTMVPNQEGFNMATPEVEIESISSDDRALDSNVVEVISNEESINTELRPLNIGQKEQESTVLDDIDCRINGQTDDFLRSCDASCSVTVEPPGEKKQIEDCSLKIKERPMRSVAKRGVAPALPYLSPSKDGHNSSTNEQTTEESQSLRRVNNDKEMSESVERRRAALSAKSESLMIRIQDLKRKQSKIRSRIASLHHDEEDVNIK